MSLSGPNSAFPLHGQRKIQRSAAFPSADAESTSAYYALRMVGLPSLDLWGMLLNRPDLQLHFREDNQAMAQVLSTGKNPTMRHLRRVQHISIRAFYGRACCGGIVITYNDTDKQAAYIHTKMFTDPETWNSNLSLIQVVNTDKYKTYSEFIGKWIEVQNAPPKEKENKKNIEPTLDDSIRPSDIGAHVEPLKPPSAKNLVAKAKANAKPTPKSKAHQKLSLATLTCHSWNTTTATPQML